MKNVADILRQSHDVLYDELDRNVREMTVTESDFIRDCLDEMDNWIQNAERKFKRADSVKSSRKSIKSGVNVSAFEFMEDLVNEGFKKDVVIDVLESRGIDADDNLDMISQKEIRRGCEELTLKLDEINSSRKSIKSECHGKSDKLRREKKEDELESSSRYMKSSPDMLLRNRAREIFRRFDDLSPDYQEDILIKFDVNDKDDLADYVMAYGNGSAIDELDDAIAEAEIKLYSSRNAKTFSKFNRISSLFIKNDVLKPGKTGIELDINGWKIINKEGKPTGGEAAEFNSEKAARDSEIFKKLVDRYGADKVRTFKQS